MRRLIIMRHGHTFEADEEPRRVGRRTDLALVERGREKVLNSVSFIKNYPITKIISSNLKRTLESASIIKQHIGFTKEIEIDSRFNEIDYGPDEDKPESAVIARIGKEALQRWEKDSILPEGWIANIEEIKQSWIGLADSIKEGETILVMTSAGVARFAPTILKDVTEFYKKNSPKINPGHLALFEYKDSWIEKYWNYSPM